MFSSKHGDTKHGDIEHRDRYLFHTFAMKRG
jgi:hypothetical protein